MEISRSIDFARAITAINQGWSSLLSGSVKLVEQAQARATRKQPTPIAYIVLTHSDFDHSGSVAQLRELTKAKVAIHRSDAPRLSGEMKLRKVKGAVGALQTLMSPFLGFKPVKSDILRACYSNFVYIDTHGGSGKVQLEGQSSQWVDGSPLIAGNWTPPSLVI